tara:strand:- start:68 stop:697 length:630 start_codon:yes stop_codon:yes gene_type:complete
MKILIISPPRAGSSSLIYSIAELSNYESIYEPYIDPLISKRKFERAPYPYSVPDNCVVKMLSYQVPKKYGKQNKFLDYIVSVYKDYDKVILLNRKNEKEHFESLVNLQVKNNRRNWGPKAPSKPWYYDDISDELHQFDSDLYARYRKVIDEISTKLSIPIIYYEDLYGLDRDKSLKIIKSLDLDLDVRLLNEKLHPKFKYRQDDKRPLI